ncbi:MAG: hypothetical protein RM022_022860 [Nostoc sp. EfeVER01]
MVQIGDVHGKLIRSAFNILRLIFRTHTELSSQVIAPMSQNHVALIAT